MPMMIGNYLTFLTCDYECIVLLFSGRSIQDAKQRLEDLKREEDRLKRMHDKIMRQTTTEGFDTTADIDTRVEEVKEELTDFFAKEKAKEERKLINGMTPKQYHIWQVVQEKRKKKLDQVMAAQVHPQNISQPVINQQDFMVAGPGLAKLVPKTDFMKQQQRMKEEAEKRRLASTTTPMPEYDCNDLKVAQFMAIGEPRNIIIAGFPKSGAMWIKSVIDTILPYYYWLEEVVSFS